ncbi:PH domain-containing protein [Chloroflexales bacterium ZM16-3]|nr:PH domain-containing protein [Chloroflexales bacterium ZM16-3]
MGIEQAHAKISAAIWQALAQSGIDLSTISREQQGVLVSTIADNLLVTVDELMDELDPPAEAAAPDAPTPPTDEQQLWSGRPFLSVGVRYEVTDDRVVVRRGLLNITQENYELIRIQDIDFTQNVGERMANIGDITLRGGDASGHLLTLTNVHRPEEVHNIIRRAVAAARERHRVILRDQI